MRMDKSLARNYAATQDSSQLGHVKLRVPYMPGVSQQPGASNVEQWHQQKWE